MGRLALGRSLALTLAGLCGCFFLTSCSSGSPTQVSTNQIPASVSLKPSGNVSLEVGQSLVFAATADNSAGTSVTETFTYESTAPSVVTVANNGDACAGSWDSLTAPSVCTPGSTGTALVTAVANGVPSAPVTVYVHQHVTSVVISKVPNQPPTLTTSCYSKGAPNGPESALFQAAAFNGSSDITSSVGPFTWQTAFLGGQTSSSPSVALSSPPTTAPLNQEIATASNPGTTLIFASVSGTNSQSIPFTTCAVQSITLSAVGNPATSFTVTSGTSTPLNATVTDTAGMNITGVSLTWSTSNPTSVTVTGATSTVFGGTASVSSPAVGSASVTASCTPPGCNGGILPSMPIYAQQAFSFAVRPSSGTGTTAASSPTIYVSSTGCSATTSTCLTQVVPVTRSATNAPFTAGTPVQIPFTPNSAVFDRAGTNEYFGVDSSAFGTQGLMVAAGTSVTKAPGLPGKVLAISPDGNTAILADTTDSPQEVFICGSCSGSSRTSTPILFSGATAAAFSPDNLKAYIVSGTSCPGTSSAGCLLVHSTIDADQYIPLGAPAKDTAFIGDGAIGYIAGGSAGGSAYLPTCGPSAAGSLGTVNFTPGMLLALPDGQSLLSLAPPTLQTVTAIFSPSVTGPAAVGVSGCPSPRGLLTVNNTVNSAGNLGVGSFTPSQFFLSADGSTAYILGAPTLSFVIQFNLSTQTAFDIALSGNATPLGASLSPAGDLLFVGASDGTLHVIDTTTLADTQQVTFPFPENSICVGPGSPVTQAPVTCNPDLVNAKP